MATLIKEKERKMRKIIIVLAASAFLLVLGTAGVQADQVFPNETEVQSWSNGIYYGTGFESSTVIHTPPPQATWYDRIGAKSVFETFGATLTGTTLAIKTNWDGANMVASFTSQSAVTAMLFIKTATTTGLNWDYAIALGNMDPVANYGNNGYMGNVYTNVGTNYNTSQTYFNNKGLIYGGLYNTGPIGSENANNAVIPVWATGTEEANKITVNWTDTGGADPRYVSIDLLQLAGYGFDINAGWTFVWGTGTCANDTALGTVAAGTVPVPGALVLLGSGLFRLAAYARKRRMAA
jgi:hypothetical protein